MRNLNHMIRFVTTTMFFGAFLLTGCASLTGDRGSGAAGERRGAARDIPADAKLVASGQPPLSFLFPAGGGKVYLYDQSSDSLLHTADLGTGNTTGGLLLLDPERRVFAGRDVNTKPEDDVVLVKAIDPKHRFAIYFQAPALKVEQESDDSPGPTTRPAGGAK